MLLVAAATLAPSVPRHVATKKHKWPVALATIREWRVYTLSPIVPLALLLVERAACPTPPVALPALPEVNMTCRVASSKRNPLSHGRRAALEQQLPSY